MTKRRDGTPPIHTITSAPEPLGADIDRRARRYLFQMGLRTVCFLAAVLTWGRVPTAVSVGLLIGAVILPYVAVVLANAGRERPEKAEVFSDLDLVQLTAAPHPVGGPSGPGSAYRPAAARAGLPVWDEAAWRPVAETFPDGAPRSTPPRG